MGFTEVKDRATIEQVKRGYRQTKLFNLLYEFRESGYQVAEVDTSDYAHPSGCTAALKQSIKRFGFNMDAVTQNGKTYLVNNDVQ